MEEKPFHPTEQDRINSDASDWISKQDLGFTSEEQDAFFEWLAVDPRHGEAFSKRKSTWNDLNVLAEWRPEHSLEPNPDLLAVSKSQPIIKWVSALSALAAVFLIGLLLNNPWSQASDNEPILLAAEEGAMFYEYHVMEDGSIIELNRGTQVAVSYSENKRSVKLMAGEAHFTVAKDSERPFVVQARNTLVKAIGTAFNVSLSSEEIEVVVTEGKVVMSPSVVIESEELEEEPVDYSEELVAGQRSLLSIQDHISFPVIEEISNEQITRRLAWKDEALNFTGTPLSDVILEFNRRNHTQLVLGDSALESRKVTATLRPNNLQGFIEMIELSHGIQSKREGNSKIILYPGD